MRSLALDNAVEQTAELHKLRTERRRSPMPLTRSVRPYRHLGRGGLLVGRPFRPYRSYFTTISHARNIHLGAASPSQR